MSESAQRIVIDELIMQAGDGDLDADGQAQLASLLENDLAVASSLVAILDVEAALRARRRNPALVATVMAGTSGAGAAHTVDAVMKALEHHRPWGRPRLMAGHAGVVMGTLGAMVLALGLGALVQRSGVRPRALEPSEPVALGTGAGKTDPHHAPRFSGPGHADSQQDQPALPGLGFGRGYVIFDIDFENGESLPGTKINSAVVFEDCPPRGSSRNCLLGGMSPDALKHNVVMIEAVDGAASPLGSFDRRRVLQFDYFLGPHAPRRVVVQMKDRDQRQNHNVVLTDAIAGRWARAMVRIQDLRPILYRDRPIDDGDVVHDFSIIGGAFGRDTLFVDNIRFFENEGVPVARSTAGLDVSTEGSANLKEVP